MRPCPHAHSLPLRGTLSHRRQGPRLSGAPPSSAWSWSVTLIVLLSPKNVSGHFLHVRSVGKKLPQFLFARESLYFSFTFEGRFCRVQNSRLEGFFSSQPFKCFAPLSCSLGCW